MRYSWSIPPSDCLEIPLTKDVDLYLVRRPRVIHSRMKGIIRVPRAPHWLSIDRNRKGLQITELFNATHHSFRSYPRIRPPQSVSRRRRNRWLFLVLRALTGAFVVVVAVLLAVFIIFVKTPTFHCQFGLAKPGIVFKHNHTLRMHIIFGNDVDHTSFPRR